MKIFIGKDQGGKPTSALLATDVKLAEIAWAGMKDNPHSIEEVDPNDDNLGINGVVFLLTSKAEGLTGEGMGRREYRKWKRGL